MGGRIAWGLTRMERGGEDGEGGRAEGREKKRERGDGGGRERKRERKRKKKRKESRCFEGKKIALESRDLRLEFCLHLNNFISVETASALPRGLLLLDVMFIELSCFTKKQMASRWANSPFSQMY